jgi:K+-sensing histidine kinase KdpD
LFHLKVDDKSIFVKFKLKDIVFDGRKCSMVILEDRTTQRDLDKLEINNKMVKMHTSCVSHDMRSPLEAIDQIVEMVINIPGTSRKVLNLLKPAKNSLKMIKMQVHNLLDHSLLQ